MIKGVHAMFYSAQADELRSFLRDKLGLKGTDVGQGWLVFDVPEAEMGCHPADLEKGAPSGTHHISFYCDDLAATVAALQAKGVSFTTGIEDHGYGLVTHFQAPGEFTIQLYQPRYRIERKAAPKPKRKKPAAKPARSHTKSKPRAKAKVKRPRR